MLKRGTSDNSCSPGNSLKNGYLNGTNSSFSNLTTSPFNLEFSKVPNKIDFSPSTEKPASIKELISKGKYYDSQIIGTGYSTIQTIPFKDNYFP